MEFRDLSWTFPGQTHAALSGLNLEILPGEKVLITGPSASGKSTLVSLMAGLLRDPDDGTKSGELNLSQNLETGLVLQQPEDQTVMSRVVDDVAFGLENTLLPKEQMSPRIEKAMSDIGLGVAGDCSTSILSGGQRQKLTLAGIIAMKPGLLILDEPLSALDTQGVEDTKLAVRGLLDDKDLTLVIVDHRVDHWDGLIERIVVLDSGRVVRDGLPSDIELDRLRDRDFFERVLGDTVVVAENLFVARDGKNPVVEGFDLAVKAGEIVAIRGPNGSGKTSLAMSLAGLISPVSGSVKIRGRDLHRMSSSQLASVVAVVPQNPANLFFRSSVHDELALLETNGTANNYGLDSKLGAHPLTLSGGFQRRLALTIATNQADTLLVLDEPSQSLDADGLVQLIFELRTAAKAGKSIILATHDDRLIDALEAKVIWLPAVSTRSSEPTKTAGLLAKVNPLASMLTALLPGITLLTTIDSVSAVIVLMSFAILFPWLGVNIKTLGVALLPVILAALFAGLTISLYGKTAGEVFISFGLVAVSEGSLSLGSTTALRIVAIGCPAVVLLSSVDPTRFADSLSQQARLPENFVMGGLAALRLLEVVAADRQVRSWMTRARGLGDGGRLRRMSSDIMGTFLMAVKRSQKLSLAMEARSFGLHRYRTHFRESSFGIMEIIWISAGFFVGAIALTVSIILGSFNAVIG